MIEVTEDKATWGKGEWLTEPDRKEWKDPATGFPCLANRNMGSGAWCGYVAVPPGHPAHGKDYDDVDARAHGGLTYANKCSGHICHVAEPGEPDDVWWLGFDCAHYQDYIPAMRARDAARGWGDRGGDDTYRTLSYVERECAELAKQLAEMTAA